MNKKGFTLVEIIVSISLVSVVMIFLFQIITTIKNIYDKQNNKNDIKITVAVITREVERDLSSFGLVEVPTKTCDMTNNNIIPSTATNVKCIKLIYDGNNVKNNEGYIVYYQNNGKYFLGYKRGKDNIIETQTVREINVAPKEDIDIINKVNSDMASLKITLPVRDNNDNYDLVINYMNMDNHVTLLEEYNVSVSAENGELISVNGSGKYKKDEMVTIDFTFDNNLYELVNVSCTNITCDKNQTISFTMPDSDVNIIVKLKEKIGPRSFAEDSWGIIAANTSSDVYKVGDTKQVLIGNKSYKVRIANKSTPEECTRKDFSQTACGFVVEFADIVENRQMNSTNTNVGGWKDSAMRTYANGAFFNNLLEDLRNVIIDTKVVSGHGSTTGETNFTTTDKIYLLSSHEVWEDGTSNQVSTYDTAWDKTRQLDYYANLGVTTSNYSGAIKKNNGSNSHWWLRAARSASTNSFLRVTNDGNWNYDYAHGNTDFAPAFRIG
ncbi:MAG: prepilin-type N-terminal cleavage/methylation domain-containing protein [Tenericutes bacterium]|nr:prepilin-type N-terminal cleavage/methylation domain-containing protein [Mycoplasmatota bacterium]